MEKAVEAVKDVLKKPKEALHKDDKSDISSAAENSSAVEKGSTSSANDIGFIEKEAGPPGSTNPSEISPDASSSSQSKVVETQKKEEKKKGPSAKELAKQERIRKQEEEKAAKLQAERENDYAKQLYGELPLNQSQERSNRPRSNITELADKVGQTIYFRARIQTSRAVGNKMVFLVFRQKIDTIQGLLTFEEGKISKLMVKWVAGLRGESIVLVQGTVTEAQEEVKSTTVSNYEVKIEQLHLVSAPDGPLVFTLEDAARPESAFEDTERQFNNVLLETRLDNRVLDLRTTTNQAVFRLQASVQKYFRDFLESRGFTEIHTPKLQGAATESGASVFKVSYFKGNAFLAQSPQLAKQMAIAADFERVYEIGPVFRAEDSNTHRHLTEFVGLDLEMTIEEHYHEVMELLDQLFLSMFRNLREKCKKEIDTVGLQFPCEEFKWREGPEGTLRLTFAEAVDLLVEDGVDRSVLDDINTENEKRLGRVVKAKYDTDYFIIDKFPMELRPFYTMPDPTNPKLTNSYDFFMRGEEILSGAQRVHDPKLLAEQMRNKGIEPDSMKGYMDGFRLGCPPHGGGGIGLERVLMLYLKLNNIRRATMFPRDPKRLEP